MPSAIDLLKQDHREVEQLFSRFQSTQDPAVAEKICSELEVHTAAEEEFVYPVLREDVSGGEKLAGEAEHEHAEARQIIGRLKQTTDSEHLSDVVAELKKAIEHHVAEEEGTVFPKMDSEVGRDELESIGTELEEFKRSA
jgi:iron-sulfur cluster repair protein YtfE (RIC family)